MLFGTRSEEPGALASTLNLIGSAFLGAVLAVLSLVLKPVVVADTPPKVDPDVGLPRHHVVYVKGRETPLRLSTYKANEKAFFEQSADTLELREQELNRWISRTYGRTDRRMEWEDYGAEFNPHLPLVRFDKDKTELGVISDVKFLEQKFTFVVHARGELQSDDNGLEFLPDEVYVGSFRVPGMFRQPVFNMLSGIFPLPDDSAGPFRAIRTASVRDGKLTLGFAAPAASAVATVETPPGEVNETPAPAAEIAVEPVVAGPATELASGEGVEPAADPVSLAMDASPVETPATDNMLVPEESVPAVAEAAIPFGAPAEQPEKADITESGDAETSPAEAATVEEETETEAEVAVAHPAAEPAPEGQPAPEKTDSVEENKVAAAPPVSGTPPEESAGQVRPLEPVKPSADDFLSEEYSQGLADSR